MQELDDILEKTKFRSNKNDLLIIIYMIQAWKIISDKNSDFKYTNFYSYISTDIEIQMLIDVFDSLATKIEIFRLFKEIGYKLNLLDENILKEIFQIINRIDRFPILGEVFFEDSKKSAFFVSSQIAELGIKLLDIDKYDELYIPFTNAFAYTYFTNNSVYVENITKENELIIQLINILDNKNIQFRLSNPLTNPSYHENDNLKQFNKVFSVPPMRLSYNLDLSSDRYNRFKIHKGKNIDVAHFEHILSQTKGKAVVLMPVGFTYRSGVEEEFRRYLIEQNILDSIIQLPPNIHNQTAIETVLFVIDKNKVNKEVLFINLKDNRFLKRDGRKLILKDIDTIVNIYRSRLIQENISFLIRPEEIVINNYSLSVSRYFVSKDIDNINKKLKKYKLIKLSDISEIRKSQLIRNNDNNDTNNIEIYELSPSDFSEAGYTLESGKIKNISINKDKINMYKLQENDLLVSVKGTIGKIAIVGNISKILIASQASIIIRLKDKKQAILLYMFLKSDIGQILLNHLSVGTTMPQISTLNMKELNIPILSKVEDENVIDDFYKEVKMYNEIRLIKQNIDKIHNEYLV